MFFISMKNFNCLLSHIKPLLKEIFFSPGLWQPNLELTIMMLLPYLYVFSLLLFVGLPAPQWWQKSAMRPHPPVANQLVTRRTYQEREDGPGNIAGNVETSLQAHTGCNIIILATSQ